MKIKELQVLKFYYKSFDWLIKSEKKSSWICGEQQCKGGN